MSMITKIQQGGMTYDIGIPSGLTEAQQAQIRENIGAVSESEAGVVADGTYPEMTVGEATHALEADEAINATNDSAGNSITETYAKTADLKRLLLDMEYPVGGSRPYLQFPDCPTPAEIYPNTSWEIDTAYQGRAIIGSGGSYTLGATGGSADAVVVRHSHKISFGINLGNGEYAYGYSVERVGSLSQAVEASGEGGEGKNMPPYIVVNFWKRTA